MKLNNKTFIGAFLTLSLALGFGSCTDDIAFGNKFLGKTPGTDATIDTVFNNAEYTRQFLVGTYALQYYGLPYTSSHSSASYWNGKLDALTDCWQLHFSKSSVYLSYYSGQLTSTSGSSSVFGYLNENCWELIHSAYLLQENIGRTPNMEETEKTQMKAETKCLIASTYFNMFRMYGGLPIVKRSYTYNENSYDFPRASVEETVKFMVDLLDDASKVLPWTPEDPTSETGRWTKAAAMALKCQILQFAASPLFNSDKPYYGSTYSITDSSPVWYGNYSKDRWTRCKTACEEFLQQLNANGGYSLVQPATKTIEGYRYAFRYAYVNQNSPEVIFATRVSSFGKDTQYMWTQLGGGLNERYSYSPTQEYVEMFPWADGKPFNWSETAKAGKLDQMFVKGDTIAKYQELQHRTYTRDPRLYETVMVNGDLETSSLNSGKVSGNNFELWDGGSRALNGPSTQSGYFATGYGNNKYITGTNNVYLRAQPQWVVLSLNDFYLTYAEALLQADDNFTGALQYVDMIRARVGLKGLVECNPDEDLTSNKTNLLNEILRERVCELGMSNSRYFDVKRYKLGDEILSKQLHGLKMYRLRKIDGKWIRVNDIKDANTQWWNGDKVTDKGSNANPGFYEPTHFDYEKFDLNNRSRTWWSGYDSKWYLEPFPQTEVNKGYGLTQNPGW